MEDFVKYLRRRDLGLTLSDDEKTVDSNCSEIFFINAGDWPFWVGPKGSSALRYVEQNQVAVFGSPLPETLETQEYTVEFDLVNPGVTKKCTVERTRYVEAPKKC